MHPTSLTNPENYKLPQTKKTHQLTQDQQLVVPVHSESSFTSLIKQNLAENNKISSPSKKKKRKIILGSILNDMETSPLAKQKRQRDDNIDANEVKQKKLKGILCDE